METLNFMPTKYFNFIALVMMLSFFVFVQPAPYDILIVFVFILSLFYGVKYNSSHSIPISFFIIFLISNILSFFFITDINRAIFYFSITLYLFLTWLVLTGTVNKYKLPIVKKIMFGYFISTIISSVIGILAYFQIISNAFHIIEFGRIKGFFKDPNVYGPSLVPSVIYAVYLFKILEKRKKVLVGLSIPIIIIGIFLSYSRAAWGNLLIAFITYFFFPSNKGMLQKKKNFFIFIILGIILYLFLSLNPNINNTFHERLGFQKYDNHRFHTQEEAIYTAYKYPLGIGPGQVEEKFNLSAHSLYVRILVENGYIGFVSFVLFIVVTLIKLVTTLLNKQRNNIRDYHLIIFSSLLGCLFNSFFVDSIHWRHLWLIFALAWMYDKTTIDDNS